MPTSGNGLPVLINRPPKVMVPFIDYEVGFHLRPGDVADILREVARRWHEEVEPLDLPGPKDEWGYAYRPVRGQESGFSNHASGSAIDLNATRNPRGVPTTSVLAPEQIARCRAIVASMQDRELGRPVVRWGGDYQSTPDAMHWEIANNVPAAALRRVADRVRAKWAELEDAANPAAENTTEVEMFLASVPGTEDDRVFLVGIDGKRQVPDAKVLAELRKIGIPDKGEVSSKTLSVFPTVDGWENKEQASWVADAARVNELSAKVDKLTAMVAQLLEKGSPE